MLAVYPRNRFSPFIGCSIICEFMNATKVFSEFLSHRNILMLQNRAEKLIQNFFSTFNCSCQARCHRPDSRHHRGVSDSGSSQRRQDKKLEEASIDEAVASQEKVDVDHQTRTVRRDQRDELDESLRLRQFWRHSRDVAELHRIAECCKITRDPVWDRFLTVLQSTDTRSCVPCPNQSETLQDNQHRHVLVGAVPQRVVHVPRGQTHGESHETEILVSRSIARTTESSKKIAPDKSSKVSAKKWWWSMEIDWFMLRLSRFTKKLYEKKSERRMHNFGVRA